MRGAKVETCADVCTAFDQICVSGGWAGVAGLMVTVPWFGSCDRSQHEVTPIATCDEELLFVSDGETHSMVKSCCSRS